MDNPKYVSLEIGDPPKRASCMVSFCEASASVEIPKVGPVHIPWSELIDWLRWLAENAEEK